MQPSALGLRAHLAMKELRALAREFRRLPVEARRHRPSPPLHGLVLEVGGGQAPYGRTDVVVDKYPLDDFERPGEAGMSYSKPLIVADGEHLPFADRAFSYVIAQHVLEHATDPARFAQELGRVAAAGFVQVPTRESELVFGWAFHPWLIDLVDGELVFIPRGDARAPAGDFMHQEFRDSPLLRLAWGARRSQWHHSLEWRGGVAVRAEGASRAEHTAAFDGERVLAVLSSMPVPPLPEAVERALRCPVCSAAVATHGGMLTCAGCGRRFPIAGNVPLLVKESAVEP